MLIYRGPRRGTFIIKYWKTCEDMEQGGHKETEEGDAEDEDDTED